MAQILAVAPVLPEHAATQQQITAELADGMTDGAFGLSTGLFYGSPRRTPCSPNARFRSPSAP